MNKYQKLYLKNLRNYLPNDYPHTEQFISSISQDIENYLEYNQNADYESICLEFGSPEELASSVMDEFTPAEITKTFHQQKKRHRLIFLLYAILFLFTGILLIIILRTPVEITETTIIHETEYIYITSPTESEEP